jgi:hypothetical protein
MPHADTQATVLPFRLLKGGAEKDAASEELTQKDKCIAWLEEKLAGLKDGTEVNGRAIKRIALVMISEDLEDTSGNEWHNVQSVNMTTLETIGCLSVAVHDLAARD